MHDYSATVEIIDVKKRFFYVFIPGTFLTFLTFFFILPTFLGRLPKVELIILEEVRPSVHKKFLRFEWNLVCRGRWVMHDGMPYGRIQGQGHQPWKVWIPSIFKTYLLRHLQWELANDH